MERLTCQHGKNHAVPSKLNLDFAWDMSDAEWQELQCLLDRLAAYENTNLAPEQITELQENYRAVCEANVVLETANDLKRDELTAIQREIEDGTLVRVVRCKDCVKRCTPMCAAKHERADMDYCSHGERSRTNEH